MRILITPASKRAQLRVIEPLQLAGADVRVVDARGGGRLGLLRNMSSSFVAAACTRADVVLTDEAITFTATAAWRGARLRGRPFILRPRGDWWQETDEGIASNRIGVAGSPRALRAFRECYKAATGIIPVGAALGQDLIKRLELDPARVVTVPISTDIERFRPAEEGEADAIKRELGYDCPHMLPLVTNFQFDRKIEGLELFLPVLRALVEARTDTIVVIAGGGPLHEEFLERNGALLDHPRLVAPGFVKGVERLYRAGSIVPYFSLLDGCPNVPLEAWASGRAVVVNDYAPLLENLCEGETGMVLRDPKDVGGCVEVLSRLLDNDDLRHRMGERSRQMVEAEFTATAIGKRLLAAIEGLIEAPTR